MNPKIKFAIAGAIIASVIAVSLVSNSESLFSLNDTTTRADVVRIGYFPNINHAQAVIGLGNGDFQKALGNVKVETQIFNAGPSAIEALFANHVGGTYGGSNPAINGYIKSDGESLRIIAGAASGGAVFVVRNDAEINSVDDFSGKKFSSPQLGNTQDVALRAYLLKNGYKTTENGGNVEVIPVKNAHIIVSTEYLKNHPDVVKKLLAAHVDETQWINQNKEESFKVFNAELEKLTGKTIPEDELQEAFSRMEITYDPVKESLFKSASDAFDIGFLGDVRPDISGIYDLKLLNEVLEEKRLEQIP